MNIERPVSKQPIPETATMVFKGEVFEVYQWEQVNFRGEVVTFEKVKRPDTVVIFPVMSNGNILLTRETQPGKAPFWGAFGGRVDRGEDVLSAAKRELLEESGYEAENLSLWSSAHPTSKVDWVVYNFIAKGLKKVSEPQFDGGEEIETVSVTFEEFVDIASKESFSEKEAAFKLMRTGTHPEEMVNLRRLFSVES